MTRYMCAIMCAQLLCVCTWSVEDERRTPKEVTPPKDETPPKVPEQEPKIKDDDKVLVKSLDGVRFISDPKDVVAQDLILFGVEVKNVPILDDESFRKKISPFLGKPISLSSIKKIAREVMLFCRSKGRPFVDISIPEQDITGGVVQLLVMEAQLGEIRVEGNKYWNAKVFRKAVMLKPGTSISERNLIEDLNYFNQNAFRRVKPIFKPGKKPGSTDLVLKAEERFPIRFYGGYEDTGSQDTGIDRFVTGFNWGNAFFLDHELGYGYATDIDREQLQSHSAYWRIPLPNGHRLSVQGGWSKSEAKINRDLINPGVNWQVGLRYGARLPTVGPYRHEGQVGLDFKQSSDEIRFQGKKTSGTVFDIAQFALQYSGGLSDRWGGVDFGLSGFFSPGHLTTRNTSNEFTNARIGTDPQYIYGNLRLQRIWNLPKEVTIVNRIVGQVSTSRLQDTEQLLLGGYNSVRGYDDRLVASDEGLQLNVELRSPDFMLGRIYGDDRYESRLQFLAFYDFGWAYNKDKFPNEEKRTYLESVGGGVRYRMGTHVNVRFDYGHQLRILDGGIGGGDHGRIHLGVLVSF